MNPSPSEPRGPQPDSAADAPSSGQLFADLRPNSRIDPAARFGLIVILIGVVALVAVFASRPIYRGFKRQRALMLSKEIEELAKGTNVLEENRLIRTAIGLTPREPVIVRQAAQYLDRVNSPDALTYWEILVADRTATRQDRLDYIRSSLAQNRLETAQLALQEILKTSPEDREALDFSIQLLRRKNDLPRAVLAARLALRAHPTHVPFQFALGELLTQFGTNAAQHAEGRRFLWNIAVSEDARRPDALALLAEAPELTRGEGEVVIRTLLSRTNLTLADRLAVGSIRAKLAPEQRATLLEATLQALPPITTVEDFQQLGHWLLANRAPDQVLKRLPETGVGTNVALVSLRLEALAQLEKWPELRRQLELNAEPPPQAAALFTCLRGLVAQHIGPQTQVLGHFMEALHQAGNDLPQVVAVARYAERAGATNAAVEAWKLLAHHPVLALTASRELYRLGLPMEDVRVTRDALARVAELTPSDANVVPELAYLNFLMNENVASQLEGLKRLAPSQPTNRVLHFSRALGELRLGNASAALNLLEESPVDWEGTEPRWKALYATVLAANQQRDAARSWARKIDVSKLKPAERELLRGL